MTNELKQIIEGCHLGGCSLEQRLAAIDFSTIPAQQREAEIIVIELKRRKEVAA